MKWFANSRPGVLADAYSKSMTTSCLWVFWGRRRGEGGVWGVGGGGRRRRMLPYCVYFSLLV